MPFALASRRPALRPLLAATAAAALLASAGIAAAERFQVPGVVTFGGDKNADIENAIAAQLKGRVEGGGVAVDPALPGGQWLATITTADGPGDKVVFADVSATFAGGAAPAAGPGIVVRYAKDAKTGAVAGLAFVRTQKGWLAEDLGFKEGSITTSGSLPDLDPETPVRLTAREVGALTEFYVNGKRVASMSGGSRDGHAVGLIVRGSGAYRLDNYGRTEKDALAAAATDAADDAAPAPAPAAPETSEDRLAKAAAAVAAAFGAKTDAPPAPPPAPEVNPPPAPPVPDAVPPMPPPPSPDLPPPLPPEVVEAPLAVFVAEGGRPAGPFDAPALRERIARGTLKADTRVWMKGMAGWTAAGEVPAVAALLPGTPPPLPPGPAPTVPDVTRTNVPAPAGADPAADPVRYLGGNWTSEVQQTLPGLGPSRVTLRSTFMSNGQATAQGTIFAESGTNVPISISGTWSAEPMGPRRFTYRFSGTMATYNSPGAPQMQPVTDSAVVEVVDENTARTTEGVVMRRVR